MGAIAEALSDIVILTNDNPRSEAPGQILTDIQQGMTQPDKAQILQDRHEAIAQAIADAKPGDMVLIAGKGHEAWQQIEDLKIPFSDIDEVTSQLDVWT
jgi:UDP-N-acetylmuramoyl-L-alanyl-D-glutamate--2,6-diaminopimelate ligase